MSRHPEAAVPALPAEADPSSRSRGPGQWLVEDDVTIAVDGTRVWDAEEERPLAAVVVRMPPHVARHLAGVLDDWSTISRILESSRGADERDLAGALHQAASAAEALRPAVPE